jgi:hypothetical protein
MKIKIIIQGNVLFVLLTSSMNTFTLNPNLPAAAGHARQYWNIFEKNSDLKYDMTLLTSPAICPPIAHSASFQRSEFTDRICDETAKPLLASDKTITWREQPALVELSRDEMVSQICVIRRKLTQCERRALKFQELRKLQRKLKSEKQQGEPEDESGGRRGGKTSEIDPDAWLHRLRRRTRGLRRQMAILEQNLAAIEELEYEEAQDDEDEPASSSGGGFTVAWAACDKCGRERITTRLLTEAEQYRCGDADTWANRRNDCPINCR